MYMLLVMSYDAPYLRHGGLVLALGHHVVPDDDLHLRVGLGLPEGVGGAADVGPLQDGNSIEKQLA